MKKITINDTYTNQNSACCIAREYDFQDPKIDLAVCDITGRYPSTGVCYNEISKEILFILKGRGSVTIEGKKIPFEANEAILIEPLEKYFIDGNCQMIIVCNPAWSKEQNKCIGE